MTKYSEIKCDPKFDDIDPTISNYSSLLSKLLEVKTSRFSKAMSVVNLYQYKGEKVSDFSKRIRIESHGITEKKEELMVKAFIDGLANKKIATVLAVYAPKTLDEAVESIKEECSKERKSEAEDNQ